jgi:peroxiredoxin
MVDEGDRAPDFELPGLRGSERGVYRLSDCVTHGGVLLAIHPCDFSPLCEEKLCTLRDVEWFEFQPEFSVLGISQDSLAAHDEFIDRHDIPFPLLSDTDGRITHAYDVQYDCWERQPGLPRRTFLILDESRTVRYRAVATEATEVPDLGALLDAVRVLAAVRLYGPISPSEASLSLGEREPA